MDIQETAPTSHCRTIKKFVGDIFKDEDGKASYTRVFGSAIIVSVIVWISIALALDRKMPDLTGAALLVSGSSGVIYAANAIKNAFK